MIKLKYKGDIYFNVVDMILNTTRDQGYYVQYMDSALDIGLYRNRKGIICIYYKKE
jgi:hypothetical protein